MLHVLYIFSLGHVCFLGEESTSGGGAESLPSRALGLRWEVAAEESGHALPLVFVELIIFTF